MTALSPAGDSVATPSRYFPLESSRENAVARRALESPHQYVDRGSGAVVTEELFGDRIVRFLYSGARENAPLLFRALTGARASSLLALLNFDLALSHKLLGNRRFLERCGVDLAECVEAPEHFDTPRKIFERQIRYWETRPLDEDDSAIVSPADARVVVGSLDRQRPLFIKGKFFELGELLGDPLWRRHFDGGDFAVFRLTPDKYHYNHAPVSGIVRSIYELGAGYHSCNPSAVVEVVTPYSKNKRVVTVIDTDIPGGSRVGLVAMIEVVALMIGSVKQGYSTERYDAPRTVAPGLFMNRGAPKSLYRPGSSTDVLLFQPGRVDFATDLLANQRRADTASRFCSAFGVPLVETDVAVRSTIGRRRESGSPS